MDSGNSGSMQSSSGGDEEYDSRAESISALLNSSAQMTMLNPPPPSQHPPLFESLSSYLENFSRSPPPAPPPNMNSLINLDMGWARGPRSDDPNCTDVAGLFKSSSSSSPISGRQPSNLTNPSYMNPSSGPENGGRPSTSADQPNVVRNSKKRSRASRRAPTTVLTTDTTNFRAMVQEFTGIPSPPFSASSFPRTRLDLFGTGSALRSGLSDPSPPPYLLRPFVHKVHTRPSFPSFPLSSASSSPSSSSAVLDAVGSLPTAANSISISANATPSAAATPNLASASNYQLPSSDLGLPKQQQNPPNMQNPMFIFQSLQSPPPPKFPSAGLSVLGGKNQGPTTDSQLRMGTLEGFSMNQAHVNAHQQAGGPLANLISTDGMGSRGDDSSSWGAGVGSSGGDQGGHLRSFEGNFSNSQRVSSCKVNYTASSSDFHVDKGSENVASRGEGMVDSWICSSD